MQIKLIDFGYEKAPKRAHYNDVGADVNSTIDCHIAPGCTRKIPLGFGLELPDGYMAIMMPRSGHASKGVVSQIAPGDPGYRGELHAIITNTNNVDTMKIQKGDRIAQLVIVPVIYADFVKDLGEERGTGNFGSTGVK